MMLVGFHPIQDGTIELFLPPICITASSLVHELTDTSDIFLEEDLDEVETNYFLGRYNLVPPFTYHSGSRIIVFSKSGADYWLWILFEKKNSHDCYVKYFEIIPKMYNDLAKKPIRPSIEVDGDKS